MARESETKSRANSILVAKIRAENSGRKNCQEETSETSHETQDQLSLMELEAELFPKQDERILPMNVAGTVMKFKADSGADINAMSSEHFQILMKARHYKVKKIQGPKLNEELTSADNNKIEVTCTFEASISRAFGPQQRRKVKAKFYVIDATHGAIQPLLGFLTMKNLDLIELDTPFRVSETASNGMEQIKIQKLTTHKCLADLKDDFEPTNENKIFPVLPMEPVKLDVNPDIKPVRHLYNYIPKAYEKATEEKFEEMELSGIIEPAEGKIEWLSRIHVVPKATGGFRLVNNLIELNKALRRSYYQLPSTAKLIQQLSTARFKSKYDLSSAFFHIPLHKDSRPFTCFMTAKGPMQYTRLCMGISIAPEVFQKTMDDLFKGCEGVLIYLDDLCIFADTQQELQMRTERVMEIIKRNNIKLNESKTIEGVEEIEFLGSIVGCGTIRPTAERIESIKHFKLPRTIRQLRAFIGFVNFIASHLKNFSSKMEPMRAILIRYNEMAKSVGRKAAGVIDWTPDEVEAFGRIKTQCTEEIVIKGTFIEDERTALITDASGVGLGLLLVQFDCDGNKRAIECCSRALTQAEMRYPQTEREALAIVWGVTKFYYYLLGRDFEIYTDHAALLFIFGNESKKCSKRSITRAETWALQLSMYRFRMFFVAGTENAGDLLSR